MAALAQHDIEQAITVEITDIHTCRGFAFVLQQQNAFKGAEDLFRGLRRLAHHGDQDESRDCASGKETMPARERSHLVIIYRKTGPTGLRLEYGD